MQLASAQYRASPIKTVFRWILQIVLIFAVSALIVFERGVTLVQPSFLLPLSCFSAVLVVPIMIGAYRQNPERTMKARLYVAVARATGAIVLILIVSVVLVNVLFPGYGHPIVPDAEASCWAFVLSLTAATSAAASLALLVSHISLNAAKWGFRVMILAVVLIYKVFLGAWTVSWYNLVDEWGFTLVALTWWLLLAAIAATALVLLSRKEIARPHSSL